MSIKVKDIYLVDLKGEGHMQIGMKPCVILSNNAHNNTSDNITVVPLTKNIRKKKIPTHYIVKKDEVNNLTYDSVALCENITTQSQQAIVKKVGTVKDDDYNKILECVKIQICC